MGRKLIQNINSVTKPTDDLYILGDYCWWGPEQKWHIRKTTERINCRLHLILGNHDKLLAQDYVDCGFASAHTSLEVNGKLLFHDPVLSIMFPENLCVVGHVHTFFKTHKNCINVGVDVWDFMPVTEDQLNEEAKKLTYV